MDMILLDWTRMGDSFCLAGVVADGEGFRVVRPLLARYEIVPWSDEKWFHGLLKLIGFSGSRNLVDNRNVAWADWLLKGHSRWEIFQLLDPQQASPQPPHVEDHWIRAMRSRRRLAPPEQRRTILSWLVSIPHEPLFGVPLETTKYAAFLQPGTGERSLATIAVPSDTITFQASLRDGRSEPDVRVAIDVPGVGARWLPVKDHQLLSRVEATAKSLNDKISLLNQAVIQMGDRVVVRLGLSRPFQIGSVQGARVCWLMADGFHSLHDPQP